jgi:hypothetical protein
VTSAISHLNGLPFSGESAARPCSASGSGMRGLENRFFDFVWEVDMEKPSGGVEIILVLVDHAKEAVLLRLCIFKRLIDLPQLERLFIARVADADHILFFCSHDLRDSA